MKQRQYLEIEKKLWKNCFKKDENEEKQKINGFRKIMRDFCETIINDNDVSRLSLPEGLTEEELKLVREEAAALGLNVITSIRYGKEIVYLQKSMKV